VIMWNGTAHMMQHMCLRNPMCRMPTQPSHDAPQVAQQIPIKCTQCPPRKRERVRLVMRDERVRVLEEGNEDEPVIDPDVRGEVDFKRGEEPKVRDRETDEEEPEEDAKIRPEDLGALVGFEDDGGGQEVRCPARVTGLTAGVVEEVDGETSDLIILQLIFN
jgi:hypothetical protein